MGKLGFFIWLLAMTVVAQPLAGEVDLSDVSQKMLPPVIALAGVVDVCEILDLGPILERVEIQAITLEATAVLSPLPGVVELRVKRPQTDLNGTDTPACGASVVATVVKAVGKALLKGIAALIQRVV
ncbi:MAG: hypothetical protein OEN01_14245 [Candidatus Krumholzibacteria bacterium]|nr:hypothetical protein [Candidatus Krumholzibacteria bacterium]